jgi:hypothetical protein
MPDAKYDIPTNVLASNERFDDQTGPVLYRPTNGWPDRWTIRNCAFVAETPHQGGHGGGVNAVLPDASDIGVFENCYFGGAAGQQLMWLRPSHSGVLVFKNCLFENWGADAIYCDEAGKPGAGGGTVLIDGCVSRNNNISHIRLPVGSKMYDSHIYNTGSVPANEQGQVNSRALHTFSDQRGGTVDVYNSHIDVGGHNTNGPASAVDASASGCTWHLYNCEVNGRVHGNVVQDTTGDSPERTVPEEVPETASEAVASDGGVETPPGTRFDLMTPDDAEAATNTYEFTVTGGVAKATATKPVAEGNDAIETTDDGTTHVTGAAGQGYGDGYYVDGELTDLTLNGDWTLYWDGQETTRDELLGDTSGGDSGSGSDSGSGGGGDDYETVTVDAGNIKYIRLGDGDTVANTLFDITADGAGVKLHADGNNWTIRNVGVKGQHPGGHHQSIVRVPDADATGTVEHCYFGNPQVPRSAKGGMYLDSSNGRCGTVRLNEVHVAGKVDNGFYGDGDGAHTQVVENSYFYNNTIANVRVGSTHGTPRVENTTIHVDGDNPPCGAGCSSPGSTNTRGIWAWHGNVEVVNCDVKGAPILTKAGGSVAKTDTRVGDAADVSPPAGVPMSAEEAASGTSSAGGSDSGTGGDGGDDRPREVQFTLVTAADATQADYTFEVDGGVEKVTGSGDDPAEGNDTVAPNDDGTTTVTGVAGNGYGDTYTVAGRVTDISGDLGEYDLFWDGQQVSPDELVYTGDGDGDGSDGGDDGRGGGHGHDRWSGDVSRTGDGEQFVFRLSHGLDATASGVSVEPMTKVASSDHWIAGITDQYVVVEYAGPPTVNAVLAWNLTVWE